MSEPNDQPDGVKVIYGKARMDSVGADIAIGFGSYITRVTGWGSAVNLTLGTPDHGKIKKIYNDSGSTITINSPINIQGATTDTIALATGGYVELLYLNDPDITERFRDIDSVGLTLS